MTKLFAIIATGFLFFSTAVTYANAAIVSLDPVSASVPFGQTFTVKVTIDTKGESVTSSDVILLYDSSKLEAVDIVQGNSGQEPFFPDFFQNISPTELYIGASVIDPIETKTGQGTLATITFKGKTNGITSVSFDCTAGKTSDTNISKSDKNATDIVECSLLTPGTYTIGEGNPTATISQQQPPAPTATPIPITLTPGGFGITAVIISMGLVLLFFAAGGSILLKL